MYKGQVTKKTMVKTKIHRRHCITSPDLMSGHFAGTLIGQRYISAHVCVQRALPIRKIRRIELKGS